MTLRDDEPARASLKKAGFAVEFHLAPEAKGSGEQRNSQPT
ncbi:hypothetical protein [Paraburkholderia sediminicola]